MHKRFYLFFLFFTLLLLFYPGDSEYFHIFSYNRALFQKEQDVPELKTISVPVVVNQTAPRLSAEGVYIIDADSFTPVFERNAKSRFLPASTTKIMTALVANDVFEPDEVVTVGNVIQEGHLMGLVPGERITVENLLYGTLIHSGNDATYALAQTYGFEKFVELMNKKATDIKMTDSHFINPAGLDNTNQYITPYDLALASRELLRDPYLSKIVSIKEITISDQDFKYFHELTNVNKLLGEIQGIGGLKTGFTESAGENLVSLYRSRNGHSFILVILKSLDRFQDTTNVVDWLEQNVQFKEVSF